MNLPGDNGITLTSPTGLPEGEEAEMCRIIAERWDLPDHHASKARYEAIARTLATMSTAVRGHGATQSVVEGREG